MGSGTSLPRSASSVRSTDSRRGKRGTMQTSVTITVTEDQTGLRPNCEWTETYFNNQPASEPYSDDDLETVFDDCLDARSVIDGENGIDLKPSNKSLHASTLHVSIPKLQSLQITGFDTHLNENQKEHRTDEYENENLVIRRGQNFKLTVNLNRKHNPQKENLYLRFAAKSKHPRQANGTLILLSFDGSGENNGWTIKQESSEDGFVTATVNASSGCIVGPYGVTIVVKNKRTGLQREFKQTETIYILFNPWCERDSVYMSDEKDRQEYVLEDFGLIWRGNYRNPHAKMWNFGQFDKDVVDTVLEILHDFVRVEDRGNPVKVTRILPAILNAAGRLPGGVLSGKWDGLYKGGSPPTQWQGSVKILEEYRKHKKPVKYGQCWVFAGLFTTVFRCIGIPTRCVTNFFSAHDSDDSMVIDKFVSHDGVDIRGGDSVWIFHAWNEAWMTRHDLDPSLDGWQAVDVTPQETSEGIYQCGPAPVEAIKRGLVNQGYETRFIFAEINADRVTWMVVPDKHHRNNPESAGYELVDLEKNAVGKMQCTKAVGSNEIHDVTMEYKHVAGSDGEKEIIAKALAKGMQRGFYYQEPPDHDIVIYLDELNDITIGDSFELKAQIANLSDESRKVTVIITLHSTMYTGVIGHQIKRKKLELELGPRDHVQQSLSVLVDDYIDKLEEQGLLTIFALLTVKETDKTISKREDIRVKMPDLTVNSEVTGSEVKLTVQLTNPLDRGLTNCLFVIEGSKMVKPFSVKQDNIRAKESITRDITFRARNTGLKPILVGFESDQLRDVTGHVLIRVRALEC
ncbi:coagulation factor XIII A chain-like [Lytechinus pictus]|uniref:coagulation factor XIII A chain-like n=1 Tax=Lytechinus pictus TaxID=7653 RepID=UPI0030B9E03B